MPAHSLAKVCFGCGSVLRCYSLVSLEGAGAAQADGRNPEQPGSCGRSWGAACLPRTNFGSNLPKSRFSSGDYRSVAVLVSGLSAGNTSLTASGSAA